jgi:low temperature requirement protein LtrA
MAFTWFANVFDTDDGPYRLLMFVMIAGSLGLAAGVPQIAQMDFRIGVISYVVMRLAYVAQWLRVLRTSDPRWQPVAARMIALTTISQLGWVAFLWLPGPWRLPAFVVWFAVDIATPFLAGWDARAAGHRHHIVERYGLFTIIVLGESIAAATVAVGEAIGLEVASLPLLTLAAGGLVIVASLWWTYFDFMTGRAPASGRAAQYLWAYLHYFVFAGVAAVGAGLSLAVAWLVDPAHVLLGQQGVALAVAAPVAAVLLTVLAIEALAEGAVTAGDAGLKLVGIALVLLAALFAPLLGVPGSVLGTGLVLAGIVAVGVGRQQRLHAARPMSSDISG